MSRNIGQKKRFEILQRDGFACKYCGQKPPYVQLEVDHIVPRSEGGTNDINNLITACFNCNRGKGGNMLGNDSKNLYKIKIADGAQKVKSLFFTYWNKQNLGNIDKKTIVLLYHYINSDMLFDSYKGFLSHPMLDNMDGLCIKPTGKDIMEREGKFILGGDFCDEVVYLMVGETYSSLLGDMEDVLDDSIWNNIPLINERLNYCLTESIVGHVEQGFSSKYFLLKYTLFPNLIQEGL